MGPSVIETYNDRLCGVQKIARGQLWGTKQSTEQVRLSLKPHQRQLTRCYVEQWPLKWYFLEHHFWDPAGFL